MSIGKAHLTKLAAAQRQLRAAIRMYFGGEDDLAIHTVASAAYRLLADIKAERGMDEAADSYLTSIFYVVRDYRRGTLPATIVADKDSMEWIKATAEQLPIDSDTKINDVSATIPRKLATEFWNRRNKVANFLKHADRDSGESLSLDEVDNFPLILQCFSAYRDVTQAGLGNEGLVLHLYLGAQRTDRSMFSDDLAVLVQKLTDVDESTRRALCSSFIAELNLVDARTDASDRKLVE